MTSLFLQQMSSMSLAVAAGMRMAPPQSAQNRSMELKLTWSFQRWEPQVQEMPSRWAKAGHEILKEQFALNDHLMAGRIPNESHIKISYVQR